MNYWLRDVEQFDRLVIYGAGNYGRKVYKKLKEYGFDKKVLFFCISGYPDCAYIENCPVYSFCDVTISGDTLVIISLGSANFNEIVDKIQEKGIKNWIDGRRILFKSFDLNDEQRNIQEKRIKNYLENENFFNGKKEIRASHVTYAYLRNAGDIFLSHCIRKYLDFKYYNIIHVAEAVTERTIEEINKTDVLIIGGGGLFLPDTNKNEISGWQWAISKELLAKINVPIIVYTVGYNFYRGQAQTDLFRDSVNELVRKASFIGLRNFGSVKAVRELVDEDLRKKVEFQPCITTITSSFMEENEQTGKGAIALNMGLDRLENRFGNAYKQQKIFEAVARAIKKIEQKGYNIKYYSHGDADEDFIRYLEQQDVLFEARNLADSLPLEIQRAYENVELVLGMRGHAQMIPFGLGKKIITLSTHDKMKWFLEDIDLMECYIDLNEANGLEDEIITKFDFIIGNEKIVEKMTRAREKLIDLSNANKSKIYSIIEKSLNNEA